MGTVTGYTAAHMKNIEDTTIISGTVVGDNLILTQRNGATINAGNVRGIQGVQGVGASDMTAVYQLLSPVGAMQPYGGTTAPSGWLMCDGQPYLRAGTYNALYNAIGTAYGSSTSAYFNVPDLRQRFPMGKGTAGTGSTLGSIGGSNNAVVVTHSHSHTHNWTGVAVAGHTHTIAGYSGETIWVDAGGSHTGQANNIPSTSGLTGNAVPSHIDSGGGHNHTGSNSTDATGASGAVSGVDANLPPYQVVNWIIRY